MLVGHHGVTPSGIRWRRAHRRTGVARKFQRTATEMADLVEQRHGLDPRWSIRRTAVSGAASTSAYAAARSRATGPTTALWHAVEVHRPADEVDGACELTVCGVLARIAPGEPWPPAARDLCPACCALAR